MFVVAVKQVCQNGVNKEAAAPLVLAVIDLPHALLRPVQGRDISAPYLFPPPLRLHLRNQVLLI